MTAKIKVDEFTLTDLIREALSIPNGWKEEIYVENGYVKFTSPITRSTYTVQSDNPSEPLDSYVGDLESMSISDFEGFYERDDGQVEVRWEGQTEKAVEGEYYDEVEIIEKDEAIDRITQIIQDSESTLNDLVADIKAKEGV